MSEILHVHDESGLRRLIAKLEGSAAMAVDTEFLTERTYYPRLCLIQVATDEVLATVDPVGCRDLSALGEQLAGNVQLVVHAGAQDLAILQRRFGAVAERVFDTQIAAAFLGHGHAIGYARLVEAVCGTRSKRSQAYTDWSKRPLERKQLEYALDDVRYLLEIRDRLVAGLEDRGRLAWADEEFEAARKTAIEEPDPRRQWRRVSGVRTSDRKQLALIQELAAWREEEAQRRDVPRQRILNDRALIEIARRKPASSSQLRGMRGLHPREAERSGDAIVAAVQRGLESTGEDLPRGKRPLPAEEEQTIGVAATFADVFLKTRARELELSSQLLATRKDLERLVRTLLDGPRDTTESQSAIPLLEGWRHEVAGKDVLELLQGNYSLRVVAGKGKLRIFVQDQEGSPPDPSADTSGRTGPPS